MLLSSDPTSPPAPVPALNLSDSEWRVLELIGRRCNRRHWIRIQMAGCIPGTEVNLDTVSRWVRKLSKHGLITWRYDRVAIVATGPIYSLTDSGRGALSGR